MNNNAKRRVRTSLQTWLALVVTLAGVLAGVDVGPIQDALSAIGIPASELSDVLSPQAIASLATITGIVAGAVTRLHQAIDKNPKIPSLAIDEPTPDEPA